MDDLLKLVKKKHILIAVDSSESSKKAVEYVANIVGDSQGVRATLINLSRIPTEGNKCKKSLLLIKDLFNAARILYIYGKILIKSGFSWRDIIIRPIPVDSDSVAESIINEQRNRGCCTVVVGRRQELSRKEEFLYGSTSNTLRRITNECALWVVG